MLLPRCNASSSCRKSSKIRSDMWYGMDNSRQRSSLAYCWTRRKATEPALLFINIVITITILIIVTIIVISSCSHTPSTESAASRSGYPRRRGDHRQALGLILLAIFNPRRRSYKTKKKHTLAVLPTPLRAPLLTDEQTGPCPRESVMIMPVALLACCDCYECITCVKTVRRKGFF